MCKLLVARTQYAVGSSLIISMDMCKMIEKVI